MPLSWPGVPDDAKPFTHVRYEDDLFTQAELYAIEEEEECDAEWEDNVGEE